MLRARQSGHRGPLFRRKVEAIRPLVRSRQSSPRAAASRLRTRGLKTSESGGSGIIDAERAQSCRTTSALPDHDRTASFIQEGRKSSWTTRPSTRRPGRPSDAGRPPRRAELTATCGKLPGRCARSKSMVSRGALQPGSLLRKISKKRHRSLQVCCITSLVEMAQRAFEDAMGLGAPIKSPVEQRQRRGAPKLPASRALRAR
jgi:hypothetical protein